MDITFKVIKSALKKYSDYSACIKNIGGRQVNFPEALSENIAKLILESKYPDTKISWDKHPGDLTDSNGLKYEIKCFTNPDGPLSFGPREKWDKLIIIDGSEYRDNKFSIFEYSFPNTAEIFQNLKVSKSESFLDQINQQKRPRITFGNLMAQESFGKNIIKIFEGKI
jgi:hypothetical protein